MKSIERTTVHISDDTGTIAMQELLNPEYGTDGSKAELTRYIYSNHLQSATLELDETAAVISHEEYHPYGTTAYQAYNSTIKATAKRYRYTGKERDEESGLYYHGARYYVPWLARWTASDPLESKYAGMSSYNYSFNNPVMWNDLNGMDTKDRTPINLAGATGFSAFPSTSAVDNTSVYQRPQIDLLPDVSQATGPMGAYLNSLTLDQRLTMQYNTLHYSSDVLMADIYGEGHMGPKSEVESIINSIKQERSNRTAENIRGGVFGAVGYLADGDRGSDIGAVFDQMSLGLHFSPAMGPVPPEKVETNFGAKVEQMPTTRYYKFEKEGYVYSQESKLKADGSKDVEHRVQKGNNIYTTGFSEISSKGSLSNYFEVPDAIKGMGVSKAMYEYLFTQGINEVLGTYYPISDNFQAFIKTYNPEKFNLNDAVQAMPAAKVLRKNFYPAVIQPIYKNEKITRLEVIWKRNPVLGQ